MTCEEIKKLIKQEDLSCCYSCHDDQDEFGYNMCEIDDENGNYLAEVCCAVLIAYNKWLENKELK